MPTYIRPKLEAGDDDVSKLVQAQKLFFLPFEEVMSVLAVRQKWAGRHLRIGLHQLVLL